jgi:hypothetical protein
VPVCRLKIQTNDSEIVHDAVPSPSSVLPSWRASNQKKENVSKFSRPLIDRIFELYRAVNHQTTVLPVHPCDPAHRALDRLETWPPQASRAVELFSGIGLFLLPCSADPYRDCSLKTSILTPRAAGHPCLHQRKPL